MQVRKFRFARSTNQLAALRSFYVDGLGLLHRGGFEGHAGYDGVMVGTTDQQMEIEFTQHRDGSPAPTPTGDSLLVFYFANRAPIDLIAQRMASMGHKPVAPENPYWAGRSLTFVDPDGWRVVLFDDSGMSGR